jgi:cytochrome P450
MSLGPVVRYGPDAVSFDHPDALKPIYGHKVNTKKSDFYLSFPARPGAVSTHTAIDPKTHARKRRVMSHAFSDAALRGMEEYVLNHLRYWMQNMAGTSTKEWTAPKKVSDWTQWLAFDVMGDLCFGKSFSMLKGDVPETRRATHLLAQAAKRHNTVRSLFLRTAGFESVTDRVCRSDLCPGFTRQSSIASSFPK